MGNVLWYCLGKYLSEYDYAEKFIILGCSEKKISKRKNRLFRIGIFRQSDGMALQEKFVVWSE